MMSKMSDCQPEKAPLLETASTVKLDSDKVMGTTVTAVKVPESLVLNVGGQRFESLKKNFLTHFPNSRLWRLMHAVESGMDTTELLRHCDR